MAFNHDTVGKTYGPVAHNYTWRRPALYALGCGAQVTDLDLLLETRGPKVLPTYSVVPVLDVLFDAIKAIGGNMLTLVHGSQKCILHKPIPAEATLNHSCTIDGLYDKGKGALAIFKTKSEDEKGELIFETEWGIFYRGEGGFGGDRGPSTPGFAVEEGKEADHRIEMPTVDTQALLYRLASEDLNPIHSDPEVATQAGFPKPILHGLCTFGHAGRAVVDAVCGGDPDKVLSIEGRFSKPVFPGETIITDVWEIAEGEAYYMTHLKEREVPVITLGRVTYKI
jgi:acyl dehydratase